MKNESVDGNVLRSLIFFNFVPVAAAGFSLRWSFFRHRIFPIIGLFSLFSFSPYGRKQADCYVFASFYGDGASGLHLLGSDDGRHFAVLKKGKSFLRPGVGDYLFRDPHLMQTPDGIFHLVWATGLHRKDIGYAWSKNLTDWSPQSLIRVMEKDSVVLALGSPELHYDQEAGRFQLLWSCTVPGKFPDADQNKDSLPGGYRLNPRIYRKTSSNLSDWSETELWFNPGYPVCDASVVTDSSRYFLFFKDASNLPGNFQHNIKMVRGTSISGSFSRENPVMASRRTNAESPAAIRLDSQFVVFYHRYKTGRPGASITKDFRKWKDFSDSISLPKGARIGSVIRIPEKMLSKLRSDG